MTYRKTKFITGIGIIILLMGVLFYLGMSSSMIAYLDVKDVKTSPEANSSRVVKVTGTVLPGSVKSFNNNRQIKFLISDVKDSSYTMEVSYAGIIPDNFKPGNDVVVEGRLTDNNTFRAESLLAKCPSKYNEPVKKSEAVK
jgi:cytochrome c-type biogenesis protein CcmE